MINVLISRAKYGLLIVGDMENLDNNSNAWERIIDYMLDK